MIKLIYINGATFFTRLLLSVLFFLHFKLPQGLKGAEGAGSKKTETDEISNFPSIRLFTSKFNLKTRGKKLFDRNIAHNIKLNFFDRDWFSQLHDYFKMDITIPAKLTFENEVFSHVGVRFKGSSSYYFTPWNSNKSFDVALNKKENKQRLFGYKKLNLNNGFLDPTMVREALYLWICSHYVPTGSTSLVQLTINDEFWGGYTAVQQVNSTFFKEWFRNGNGNKWRGILSRDGYSKVLKTYNIAQPFTWQGPQEENYYGFYELRSQKTPEAWRNLIELCRRLKMDSLSELEERFNSIFAVDNALWLMALENVFMDNDSFLRKGYDYYIYEEPEHKRMYLIQHDGNEAFGTGAQSQWPKDVIFNLDPFFQTDNSNSPLVNRLLAIPAFRQRYLAHMRTVINEWLDWNILGPEINRLQGLIEPAMLNSKKPLYPLEQFKKNVLQDWTYKPRPTSKMSIRIPGLKPFIQGRRDFLLNHPDIMQAAPKIKSVVIVNETPDKCSVYSNQKALIQVEIGDSIEVAEVLLHFTNKPTSPFQHLAMFDDGSHSDSSAGDNIFCAEVPRFPAGSEICFYVEARAANQALTATFSPPRAELEFYSYIIRPPSADSTQIVINEVKASNRSGIRNPKGRQSDWIELLNIGDNPVNLTGYYLSDDEDNPRKWVFPYGTTLLPGNHLLVWADGTQRANSDLHTNFKISKNGEILSLVDSDSNWNQILDQVEIGKFVRPDSSFGRFPDGSGEFQRMTPTPGITNHEK